MYESDAISGVMDIVGAANGFNGGNLVSPLTYELHDTPNDHPITFVLRHSKKVYLARKLVSEPLLIP
jgi:hypothetical protein